MTWTAPEPERTRPPLTGGERASLEGFLDYHRNTLLAKCAGLNEEQLKRASVAPSGLSLLALVRHLTEVEYTWFLERLSGVDESELPYYGTDEDPDADFNGAAEAEPADAFDRYRAALGRARSAAASRNLEDTFVHPRRGDTSLRWVYLHMIEEYARHNGHADLIREAIDGQTGE